MFRGSYKYHSGGRAEIRVFPTLGLGFNAARLGIDLRLQAGRPDGKNSYIHSVPRLP